MGWWDSQGIAAGLSLEGRCLEVAIDLGLEGQTQVSLSNWREEAFQAEGPASAKIRTQEALCWMWSESRCEKRGGWNVVGKWRSPAREPQANAGKVRDCRGIWGWRPGDKGGLRRGGWFGELVKVGPEWCVTASLGVTSISHKHTFTRSPREKVSVMRWSLELVVKGGA